MRPPPENQQHGVGVLNQPEALLKLLASASSTRNSTTQRRTRQQLRIPHPGPDHGLVLLVGQFVQRKEIPPHRITRLRRQGERYFADGLRELPDNRRLAILAVCAVEWEMFLVDAVVETHDRIVSRTYREATRTCEAQLGDETAAVRAGHRRGPRRGDPDVGDAELRARLLSTVPEAQLREDQSDLANWTRGEDQSDLANWTRGDRKARFEQTADRHAGLSQFAGPFLSRMKFVGRAGRGSVADAVGAAGLSATTARRGTAASRPMHR